MGFHGHCTCLCLLPGRLFSGKIGNISCSIACRQVQMWRWITRSGLGKQESGWAQEIAHWLNPNWLLKSFAKGRDSSFFFGPIPQLCCHRRRHTFCHKGCNAWHINSTPMLAEFLYKVVLKGSGRWLLKLVTCFAEGRSEFNSQHFVALYAPLAESLLPL